MCVRALILLYTIYRNEMKTRKFRLLSFVLLLSLNSFRFLRFRALSSFVFLSTILTASIQRILLLLFLFSVCVHVCLRAYIRVNTARHSYINSHKGTHKYKHNRYARISYKHPEKNTFTFNEIHHIDTFSKYDFMFCFLLSRQNNNNQINEIILLNALTISFSDFLFHFFVFHLFNVPYQ